MLKRRLSSSPHVFRTLCQKCQRRRWFETQFESEGSQDTESRILPSTTISSGMKGVILSKISNIPIAHLTYQSKSIYIWIHRDRVIIKQLMYP